MPVYQVEKYYWKCPLCFARGGTFNTEDEARKDLVVRHSKECRGRSTA